MNSNFMTPESLRRATEHALEFGRNLDFMEQVIAATMLDDAQHGKWSCEISMHDFDDYARGYALAQYLKRISEDLIDAGYAVDSDEADCVLTISWREEE